LSDLTGHRPPDGDFERRILSRSIPAAPLQDVVSEDGLLRPWELRFRQSGFRHVTRVLRGRALHVFGHPPLSRHAVVPFGFRRQV